MKPNFEIRDPPKEGFRKGIALVRKGKKWLFINKSGKPLIKDVYDYAEVFQDVQFGES